MKHRKTITAFVFLLTGIGRLDAQETVSATGNDATGSGGSSSYTVGQVVYTANIGNNGSIIQGVQQPYEISNTVGILATEITLEPVAYPNPTNNGLTLKIGDYNNEQLTYQLYDLKGNLLKSKKLVDSITTISLQDLSVSTYLLNVLDNDFVIKTFKIIKN